MLKRFIIGQEDKARAQSYIWYSVGGMLDAMQSALLLMVISRTNGQDDAGVYSIAYAIASLAFAIGCFGMRNFQASDIKHKYSFRTYTSSRVITNIVMMLVAMYYCIKGVLFTGYTIDKCIVIMLITTLKLIDSTEDVFHRMYQSEERLDIAGRCLASREIVMILAFGISLIFSGNLVVSAGIAAIVSFCWFLTTTTIVYGEIKKGSIMNTGYDKKVRIKLLDKSNISLLIETLALFVGAFSTIYIGNCPKYAIDAYCSSAEQASYNYIFMPVYVIFMIGQFAYQPVLTELAACHKNGDRKGFMRLFWRQILIIIGFVGIVVIGAYFLGIPVLSLVFGTDLAAYKWPLLLLLTASGLLATVDYLNVVITVMGKQKFLIIGYALAIAASFIMATPMVTTYGVMGAVILYSGVMLTECLVFAGIFVASRK